MKIAVLKHLSPDALRLAVRIVFGAVSMVLGFAALAGGLEPFTGIPFILSLLIGFAFLITGAVCWQPVLAALFARPAGWLFYPEERYRKPQPLYSVAEAKVMQQDFEGAMRLYEQIAEEHPDDLKPYVDRIRICVVHLRDVPRAERVLDDGLPRLSSAEARQSLTEMFHGICSLNHEPADWNRSRTLSLEK